MVNSSLTRERETARSGTRWPVLLAIIGALVIFDALTFIIASLSHLGELIPLGFVVLDEPRIVPAAIVEGLCGLAFVVAAYALLTRSRRAWVVVLAAHVFSLAGVLVGMVALAVGAGPRTELNDAYHRIMLAVLLIGLVLVWTPNGRATLNHAQ